MNICAMSIYIEGFERRVEDTLRGATIREQAAKRSMQ
jgi:hypothetical protein